MDLWQLKSHRHIRGVQKVPRQKEVWKQRCTAFFKKCYLMEVFCKVHYLKFLKHSHIHSIAIVIVSMHFCGSQPILASSRVSCQGYL